jgi:hypothetical protein
VNEDPHKPSGQSRKPEPEQVCDGGGPPNDRKTSLVKLLEGWQSLSRFDSPYNGLRRILASLHGNLCNTGQGFAFEVEGRCQIPNYEYVWKSRQGQVRADLNPAASVGGGSGIPSKRSSERGSFNASGPDHRSRIEVQIFAAVLQRDPFTINTFHANVGLDLHA